MFKELFYNSKTKRQNYSNLYRWRPGTTLKGVCRAHWTGKCHNLSRPATSKIVYDLRSRFGMLGTRRRDEDYRQKVSVHKRAMQRGRRYGPDLFRLGDKLMWSGGVIEHCLEALQKLLMQDIALTELIRSDTILCWMPNYRHFSAFCRFEMHNSRILANF